MPCAISIYSDSTCSRAHGVRRRNLRLDVILGSWVKQRISIFRPLFKRDTVEWIVGLSLLHGSKPCQTTLSISMPQALMTTPKTDRGGDRFIHPCRQRGNRSGGTGADGVRRDLPYHDLKPLHRSHRAALRKDRGFRRMKIV